MFIKEKRGKLPVFAVLEKEEYSQWDVIFGEVAWSVQGHFALSNPAQPGSRTPAGESGWRLFGKGGSYCLWLSNLHNGNTTLWQCFGFDIYFSESPARVSTAMQEGSSFEQSYSADDSLISFFILCFYSVSLLAFVWRLTSAFALPCRPSCSERGTSVSTICSKRGLLREVNWPAVGTWAPTMQCNIHRDWPCRPSVPKNCWESVGILGAGRPVQDWAFMTEKIQKVRE